MLCVPPCPGCSCHGVCGYRGLPGGLGALGVPALGVRPRLFLSRGANPEVRNKEGDSPLDLTPEHSEVWVALELTRKLRQGAAGRALHTERIISR